MELLYLETKFAALMSYGLTVNLLQEVLPTDKTVNAATVRNNNRAGGWRWQPGCQCCAATRGRERKSKAAN
jgi:hypothetical protein